MVSAILLGNPPRNVMDLQAELKELTVIASNLTQETDEEEARTGQLSHDYGDFTQKVYFYLSRLDFYKNQMKAGEETKILQDLRDKAAHLIVQHGPLSQIVVKTAALGLEISEQKSKWRGDQDILKAWQNRARIIAELAENQRFKLIDSAKLALQLGVALSPQSSIYKQGSQELQNLDCQEGLLITLQQDLARLGELAPFWEISKRMEFLEKGIAEAESKASSENLSVLIEEYAALLHLVNRECERIASFFRWNREDYGRPVTSSEKEGFDLKRRVIEYRRAKAQDQTNLFFYQQNILPEFGSRLRQLKGDSIFN